MRRYPSGKSGYSAGYISTSQQSRFDRRHHREELRVTLKSFADLRQIDVRIFKNVHGVDVGTPQGVTVRPGNIRDVIEILELAEIAAKAEGLIE